MTKLDLTTRRVPFKTGGGSFLDALCPFCQKTTSFHDASLVCKCSHYYGDEVADDKGNLNAIFKKEF